MFSEVDKLFDELILKMSRLPNSNAISIAITFLETAKMWLIKSSFENRPGDAQ